MEKSTVECTRWVWHAQNFVEKTFTGSTQTMKFMIVSVSKVSHYTLDSGIPLNIKEGVYHCLFHNFRKKAELEKEVMKSAKFMENDQRGLATDTQEGMHSVH